MILAALTSLLVSLPTPVITADGILRSQSIVNDDITLLDDSPITPTSWNQSDDFKSDSLTGMLRYERHELTGRHSDRVFYNLDPRTGDSTLLFAIADSQSIKRWTEDAEGTHIQTCANFSETDNPLVQVDLSTSRTEEIGSDCASRAILMPSGEYLNFHGSASDTVTTSVYTTKQTALYGNFTPLDVSSFPSAPRLDHQKIALSANSNFLAIQAIEYTKDGTYVYDLKKGKLTQFKSAAGAAFSRSVPSNDGKLVTSYVTQTIDHFQSSFLAVYSAGEVLPVKIFVPTLRQDNQIMWNFADSAFSLDDSKLVTSASSLLPPPSNDSRRDVDVFNVKTGEHLLRIPDTWIVRPLGHDRELLASWTDRTFSILDISAATPVVTHRFTYPPGFDPADNMRASFAGHTLALTLAGKTFLFELDGP